MSRVKKRLNELREQGPAGAILRLGAPVARRYVGRRLAAYGMAAGAGLGGAAAIHSTRSRQIAPGITIPASRPRALPRAEDLPGTETVAKATPKVAAVPKAATATKVATAQPTSAPKPKKPKSRRTRTRRMRPGGDDNDKDKDKEQQEYTPYSKDAPSTIYSRVADVLRGK